MESPLSSLSVSKIAIGIGFALFGGLYTYYHYFKTNSNKYSQYITDYLREIKLMISNANGNINEVILCHINYIKNEIVVHIRNIINHSSIDERRRSSLPNTAEYNVIYKETDTINDSYLIETIEYIKASLEPFDISDSLNYLLLTNDNLINLPQNKQFTKLIPYPLIDLPQGLTDEQIDDSFFFASVNQIDYDKLLEKYYADSNSNEEIKSAIQLRLFKQKFKDEFHMRYGYDCKYLPDLIINKDGLNAKKLIILINKVTF